MGGNTTGGKKKNPSSFIYYFLFVICFALLAGGCINDPAVEQRQYAADSDAPDWWSDDELWEEEEEDEDEEGGVVPVKKQVAIDAVSGLVLGSDSTKKDEVVATLTLPLAFTVELPENIEDNNLFCIQGTEITPSILPPMANILASEVEGNNTGEVKIAIKSEDPLGFGIYRVIIKITPNDGINAQFYKKIEFTVAKTPPPFKDAPTVYPYITAPGKNKLTVTWNESPIGAKNFQVYVGTTANDGQPYGGLLDTNARTIDITDIADDETDDGLPDGITYYVWLTAINDDGESGFGPPGIRSTSFTLHKGFYKDPEGKSFFSWDSYSGDGGGYVNGVSTHKGGKDMYIITPPSDKYPGGYFQYGPSNPDGTPMGRMNGQIYYHGSWTGGYGNKGKWGESLNGVNGIIIIEYANKDIPYPTGAEGYYMGIYYYGLDSIQTVGPSVNTNFPYGMTTPVGLNICYFGNSYHLKYNRNPETATLEQAIDKFTKANINQFIAFIAVPWYRKYEASYWED